MKIRFILPTFASLMLMVVAAGTANAASVAESSTAQSTAPVQVLSTLLPELLLNCTETGVVAEPSVLNPAPAERAALPCGSCSATACLGKNLGDTCAVVGYRIYQCYMINFCGSGPGTGRFCDCSDGPY